MNLQPASWLGLLIVTLLGLSCFDPRASAATANKGAAPAAVSAGKVSEPRPAEVPKSVFNPMEGRNPFFPATSVQPIPVTVSGAQPTKTTPVDQLVCNGIVPKGERPTAMVNGHTFAEGETAEVKLLNGNKMLLKCEEIREESVIISIDGQRRELKLRSGAL